ncbi:Puff-specific protein Bx42 [Strongyloides ratti]|uniref:Puff-specific protein Bx42 n=1 Tax=Strongyloides ratti TaxID=34506 RepID=A0A090KZM5_STRRB|nr:Puff-specific protein Bx42 [Strongyloides ratti]CEF61302.1 Puff-specific protein Bx42 [Strongyloides ratti]
MSIKLTDILPDPISKNNDFAINDTLSNAWFEGREIGQSTNSSRVPSYGCRKNFVPRKPEDFGDGGAFPEIHIVQYPLGMGQDGNVNKKSNIVALQTDDEGKVRYDALAKLGHSKNRLVHTSIASTKNKYFHEDDEDIAKPNEDEIANTTEETKKALEKLTMFKIASALPVKPAQKVGESQYIRYTPSSQMTSVTGQAPQQRIIKIVEEQVDPMEPPKFKINQKVPRGPPSPPPPVLHSPTRKATAKDQADWKIPPCISNWKNPRGHVVALDKRLASDGRGMHETQINDKFGKFCEALYIAERKSREAVEMRGQMEKRVAQNEKIDQEAKMREMARKAREENKKLKTEVGESEENIEEIKQRDEIRKERLDERRRERAIARKNPEKLERLKREQERDISEKIALGLPNTRSNGTDEVQFDSRLFGKSSGLDSGGINDETYAVYDKPWRAMDNVQQHVYRPSKNVADPYGEDLDKVINTNRFVPSKGFSGTDGSAQRSGPVQFEKEDDIFGISTLFDAVKSSKKRAKDDDKVTTSSKKPRT